jgi:hypothetical protein
MLRNEHPRTDVGQFRPDELQSAFARVTLFGQSFNAPPLHSSDVTLLNVLVQLAHPHPEVPGRLGGLQVEGEG